MPEPALNLIDRQEEECYKICQSFLYFVDEYCWIEDKERKIAIPFKLWVCQKRIIPVIVHALRLIILKTRQLGLTWILAAYTLWLAITRPLQLIVVISAKEDWAAEFIERVKFIMDRLPIWMLPEINKATTQTIEFQHGEGLVSQIKSLPTTPAGAQSKTVSLLIMDETCENRYCQPIWASSKPGLDSCGGRAIFISNAKKTSPGWRWTREIYTQSMKGLNDFLRIFLAWYEHPRRSKDFREIQKREGMDWEDVIQHYPETEEEAISPLGGSYFRDTIAAWKPYRPVIGRLQLNEKFKEWQFVPDRAGIIGIWKHPEVHWLHRYAIGSDVSEGVGETYSVAYVYDRILRRFVARMRSNRVEADIWAEMLISLAEYYKKAYIGVESNGPGITTVQYLERKRYPYLYFREKPGEFKNRTVMKYGWHEDRHNKHLLVDELKRHFRQIFKEVPCGILIDECSTFIRHENGKIEHEEGKFDDCVIGAAISLQVANSMPPYKDVSPKIESEVDRRIAAIKKVGGLSSFEQAATMEAELTERHLEYALEEMEGIEGEDFDTLVETII
jgi:hypothetical protein